MHRSSLAGILPLPDPSQYEAGIDGNSDEEPSDVAVWSPFVSGFLNAIGTFVASICLPLPRKSRCLGMDLKCATRFLLVFQSLYGLVLTLLHTLLLVPPIDEPRTDWYPGMEGVWLEVVDLQFSLRIRGGKTATYQEPIPRLGGSANVAGTICGLSVGLIHLFCALFLQYSITFPPRGGLRVVEKIWLFFTTIQIPWFCLCNLGKVSVLCPVYSPRLAKTPAPARAVKEIASGFGYQVQEPHVTSFFSELADHCSILRMWFIEWTIMVSLLAAIALWVCWSYINVRLQEELLARGAHNRRSSSMSMF